MIDSVLYKAHENIFRGISIWGLDGENLSSGFANNTGADQPVHPRSLISDFVICVLEGAISKLATSEISFF